MSHLNIIICNTSWFILYFRCHQMKGSKIVQFYQEIQTEAAQFPLRFRWVIISTITKIAKVHDSDFLWRLFLLFQIFRMSMKNFFVMLLWLLNMNRVSHHSRWAQLNSPRVYSIRLKEEHLLNTMQVDPLLIYNADFGDNSAI